MPSLGAWCNFCATNVERAIEMAEFRIEQYTERVETIIREIQEALESKAAIDEIMMILTDKEQRVISMRYVEQLGWVYIGLKLNKDESRARSIKRVAIKKFCRRMNFTRFYPFY